MSPSIGALVLLLAASSICPHRGTISPWNFDFEPCIEEEHAPNRPRATQKPEPDPRWFVYVCGERSDRRLIWCMQNEVNPCYLPVPTHDAFTGRYQDSATRRWCGL